jgi:hypothetical protein
MLLVPLYITITVFLSLPLSLHTIEDSVSIRIAHNVLPQHITARTDDARGTREILANCEVKREGYYRPNFGCGDQHKNLKGGEEGEKGEKREGEGHTASTQQSFWAHGEQQCLRHHYEMTWNKWDLKIKNSVTFIKIKKVGWSYLELDQRATTALLIQGSFFSQNDPLASVHDDVLRYRAHVLSVLSQHPCRNYLFESTEDKREIRDGEMRGI